MSVFDFELGLAGLPEKTIAELDTNLPALERITIAAKQFEPLLTQAIPIITKIYPDIVAVTPLIQDLITFAKQKETE